MWGIQTHYGEKAGTCRLWAVCTSQGQNVKSSIQNSTALNQTVQTVQLQLSLQSRYLYLNLQLIWDTESTRIEVIHLGKTTVKRKRGEFTVFNWQAENVFRFLWMLFSPFFFYTLSFLFLSFFIFGFLNLHIKLCEERQKSPSTLFGNHTQSH